MNKAATMSIAEDFTIKGVRKLCEEGLIDDDTRKQIKAAIFKRAKQRNNIDANTKIGYEGNSDLPSYLVIYDKETREALNQGDDTTLSNYANVNASLAAELSATQAGLRTMREKVEALKTSMANLGL